MRYKYVFWDFNGTLIDDVKAALASVNDMLARKGREPITLDDYYTYIDTPIVKFYYHILPENEIDFSEISRDYHEDYARHITKTGLAQGIPQLLEEIRKSGAKQYIITSNHIDETLYFCKKFGIAEYFEDILGADDTFADSKTERAKNLFDSLNTNGNDVIFIGDTLHDIETANAMGADCILVSYGHQGKKLLEEHNAYTVENTDEIRNVIFDERLVDLHTHSACSDGTLTPKELVNHAKESGLSAFALTDHDGVNGLKEAQEEADRLGIEFIPGIELSVVDGAPLHIIGLFIDYENENLLKTIEKIRYNRVIRMKKTVENLQNLGFSVTYEEAEEIGEDGFVGRVHIAELMVKKGYCETVKEVFDKYIGSGKPAYVKKTDLTAKEAVKTIRESGGLAILAHLNQTKYDEKQLENLLVSLKESGLNGVEGYYTEYTHAENSEYREIARKLSLALSGGSDFHGENKKGIEIGKGCGNLKIPYYVLDNLKGVLKRNKPE